MQSKTKDKQLEQDSKDLRYKLELRAFDGSLNETKDQAISHFEDKYGFKPRALKA